VTVDALGRGFAVMSTALANTGHNCNVVTEAEALIMLKSRPAGADTRNACDSCKPCATLILP
jgi:hypothetical protein